MLVQSLCSLPVHSIKDSIAVQSRSPSLGACKRGTLLHITVRALSQTDLSLESFRFSWTTNTRLSTSTTFQLQFSDFILS